VKPTRNLITVHYPRALDPRDFEAIKEKIEARAPDIQVFIVQDGHLSLATKKKAAALPTLVFAPIMLQRFRPARGKIYCGRPIGKVEQMRRLDAAGIPVPEWMLLTPGTNLDAKEWGSHVIVKPSAYGVASMGLGVEVRRTEDITYRDPRDYPKGHPGRWGPMIVQKYIDTGQEIQGRRLATLFGRVLYAYAASTIESNRSLSQTDDPEQFKFSGVLGEKITREFVYDEHLLALGGKIHACFPEVPLQSIDVVRDKTTGKLFVLEINPGGNTWHFSSSSAERIRNSLGGVRLEDQFQAFDVAAEVLIEMTRAEAE
jgi:hypothetical protein